MKISRLFIYSPRKNVDYEREGCATFGLFLVDFYSLRGKNKNK